MLRWLREPLVHFLLIGLAIEWLAQGRPPPMPEQTVSLLENKVREEILFRVGSANRSAFFKAFEAMRARYVVVLPEAPAKDAANGNAPAAKKTR